MSCEENRVRYLTAVCGADEAGRLAAAELERLFQRERGQVVNTLDAASNEAKTRLLFAQFARCDPPLHPPTHSSSGLPRRDAQRGYARLFDTLAEQASQGKLARCPDCGQFGKAAGHPGCAHEDSQQLDQQPALDTDASSSVAARRQYTYRNADVEDEITALPSVADSDFVRQACASRQPGTAAHAIRLLLRSQLQYEARQVGEHLAELIAPKLAAIARSHFPTQSELREELVQELNMALWRDLVDLRVSQDFITYNCPCVLNREAASIAYKLRRPARHERQFERGGVAQEEWSEEDTLVAPTPSPESGAHAADVLAALQPRERLVAYLLARGVPISSPDPAQVTIAGVMGVTDRMVRNYRRAAAQQLLASGLAP